jgi:jumonji domain-containing protein 2
MLILGGSYHCGFNFGCNIAEAVNYATLSWLDKLIKCKSCNCSKNSVRASHREILDNLQRSIFLLI